MNREFSAEPVCLDLDLSQLWIFFGIFYHTRIIFSPVSSADLHILCDVLCKCIGCIVLSKRYKLCSYYKKQVLVMKKYKKQKKTNKNNKIKKNIAVVGVGSNPDGAQLVFLYFSTIHFFRMYLYQ